MQKRVAIVEDESDLRETLGLALRRLGYDVEEYPDGAEALLGFRQRVPDVVLLDWMLPGISGLDLLKVIRADRRFSSCGVLMVTARGTEMDIVTGLNQGADDYLVKPVKSRELSARIQAVTRRYISKIEEMEPLRRWGDTWLEPATYRAGDANSVFELTPTEFKLLEMLMHHPGRVYTRGQFLAVLWPDDKDVEERAVDVHIARLRDKMGKSGNLVETVRGVGYRLREER